MSRVGSRVVSWMVVAAVTAMLSPVSMVFASVNDDQVTSQKIKEADGTSGQNANLGSGVKTAHIQDGAVTDAKISGTISAAKISSVALNADTVDGKHVSDLALAVHMHGMAQVTGLETALAVKADVTHNHNTLYQQKYGKVAVVAQTGGDYSDPVVAMNDLATWCGGGVPCLLKIMPGTYNLGANRLNMVGGVDVEGAGISMTKLVGIVDYYGVNETELRMLSVESDSIGINMAYSGINKFKSVNISASAGGIFTFAPQGDLIIEDSVINVSALSGYGVHGYMPNFQPGPGVLQINDTKITVTQNGMGISGGCFGQIFISGMDMFVDGHGMMTGNLSTTVKDSSIKATRSLISADTNGSIKIANSMLDGPKINDQLGLNTLSAAKCIGLYDANFDAFSCQ